ncbi:hypothetical protein AB870_03575 [Pandoraea faecigallinarum]|uniref:APS kinase domain-containing protein n=1 Tax=Pandoraea faecigallinarum TaxID=656179 RepID=A0A0H3WS63_9BURK|nr:adenylyl-sulfate kinase [Pandoraea faecigallinarum]AKM29413.1 hypothetical protein AB870_03575 [Pandoraea faecigallinarum]
MAKIIGLTGLAGVGKDTFARALQRSYLNAGTTARIGGFADFIRHIATGCGFDVHDRAKKEKRVLFNWSVLSDRLFNAIESYLQGRLTDNDRALLWTYTIEALEPRMFDDAGRSAISISPREFMQILGTEGGQRVRKTLWVELAVDQWRSLPGIVIVTDFRFEHEAAVLDRCICVTRKDVVRVNEHVSENLAEQLTNYTRPASLSHLLVELVANNGTIADLERQADSFAIA